MSESKVTDHGSASDTVGEKKESRNLTGIGIGVGALIILVFFSFSKYSFFHQIHLKQERVRVEIKHPRIAPMETKV